MAQVTTKIFDEHKKDVILQYTKAVKMANDDNVKIRIPKLDRSTLRIVGYSDASFSNNRDLSSQLGYVVFLTDRTNTAVPIVFKSYKSKRITKSPMSSEVIAFADMFDAAVALKTEIEWILGQHIPVQLLTDSKCLFDIISKGTRTSEKRTMIDVAAAREGFTDKVISDIGLVRGACNIADGFTKSMTRAHLQNVMNTSILDIKCEQWIIRHT